MCIVDIGQGLWGCVIALVRSQCGVVRSRAVLSTYDDGNCGRPQPAPHWQVVGIP